MHDDERSRNLDAVMHKRTMNGGIERNNQLQNVSIDFLALLCILRGMSV